MNVKKLRIVLILVVALGYGGYLLYTDLNGDSAGQGLTLYGNVDIREVQLGFRVAGRLREMYFEEGDSIKAGDLMAVLDDEPMREALAVADARVLEAQVGLDLTNTGSRPQEILAAEARVSEAQAALDNANQELRRQKELTEKNLSSQRLLDSAQANRDQAAARLDANREALGLAVEGFRKEDIAAAQAALAAAVALREQASTQLEDTRLYAPSDGVVLTRAREPGSMLGIGSAVYALSLRDTVYIRAYVDEPNLGNLTPGSRVVIRTDSSPREYEGQIGFISPRAEFTPKTVETQALRTDLVYRLRIVVSDADEGLRQGMPVNVYLPDA